MPQPAKIIYCHCAYSEVIEDGTKRSVLDALTASGADFETVADLCGLAAHRDPRLKQWAKLDSLSIVACFPRTIQWLFHTAGAPVKENAPQVLNMRSQSPDRIVEALLNGNAASGDKTQSPEFTKGDWTPWFPVIDYDRCVNCKQCLNFCLFGVYTLSDDDKVTVTNPAGCKTDCPACARICPETAIIFPKYSDSPINGDKVLENQNANVNELLDGDILEMIRKRTGSGPRFASNKASKKRSATLADLKEKLDIPQSVIDSMSPHNIARLQKTAGQKICPDDCELKKECNP